MIVLDTNVVSELMKRAPDPAVLAWLDAREAHQLDITAITAAELRLGVALLPRGRRRAAIAEQLDLLLRETFLGAIVPFDEESAAYYADILAGRREDGAPMEVADGQIAAICLQHEAVLATRNTKDFQDLGIELVNPWLDA